MANPHDLLSISCRVCLSLVRVYGIACRERADKETFYEGQGRTTGGFMRMARTTLALLNKLSGHPVIKHSFLQPPLVGSSAYNCLHFLELLVCFCTKLDTISGSAAHYSCTDDVEQFQMLMLCL